MAIVTAELRSEQGATRKRLQPWPATAVGEFRAKAIRDLWFFCREIAGLTLLEPEPHLALCRFLEQPSPYGRKLILMPRGSFKSSIVSVGYVLWRIARCASERILIDSDIRANAKKFAGLVRWHIESNARFRQLFGDLTRQPGWTEDYFTVRREHESKEPTVMTSGMDQVVVSLHFDRIICDDLVNNTNITTKEQIEKTVEHYRLLSPLLELTEINPESEMILVGTRWDDADLYGHILRESGRSDQEIMRALADGQAQIGRWTVFYRAAYRGDGSPLFSLFTQAFLEEKRRELGAYHFAAQYLNDPVPVENATFRREWFRHFAPPLPMTKDEKGNDVPVPLRVTMTIDPAISERRHGDLSAIVVVGTDDYGRMYVLYAWHDRVQPKVLIDRVFDVYEQFRPAVIGLEQVAFQKGLRYWIQEEMGRRKVWLPLRELKPDTSMTKEMRIRALQPLYEAGMVWHREGLTDLEMELLRFPRGQHDDLIDALAYQLQLVAKASPKRHVPEYVPDSMTTGY
jgi:predicted phage terminase large subunit-like protein